MSSPSLVQILRAAFAIAALSAATSAPAAVLNFEGLTNPTTGAQQLIPNGYGGFTWNSGVSTDKWATQPFVQVNQPGGQNTGYHNGIVSGTTVGYSSAGFLQLTRPGNEAFTLNSLYLASAYWDDRTMRITGTSASGSYSTDVELGTAAALYVLLDWANLTSVTFQWLSPNDGTQRFAGLTGSQFVFDDLRYNEALAPVPLPAAAWLLGSGLLGFAGLGRRRRKTA